MTTFEAYKTYLALRLHFTTDGYDICKTKGHVRASTATLDKNVKLQFELQRLKRKYGQRDFINYLVANFVNGDKWGGVYNVDAESIYLDWQAIQDSLSYKYKQDLENFVTSGITSVEQLWDCTNGHPIILKRYLGKQCSLETVVILQKLFIFHHEVDDQLVFDPTWNLVSKLIHKYSPFIKIDKPKFMKITEEVFE
jgi:T4 gene Gp59 loader of gp41 DNA helicase